MSDDELLREAREALATRYLTEDALAVLADKDPGHERIGKMRGLVARIDARLASGGWMPIDSAPKDGTEIIGYREDCGVILVRWTCPLDFCSETENEKMGEDSAEQFDWFCADFVSGCRLDGDLAPTHWQPLPPLPKG